LSAALIVGGLIRHTSWRVAIGAGMLLLGIQASRGLDTANTQFWQLHSLPLCALAIAVLFNDSLARWVRNVAWPWVPLAALIGAMIYPWALGDVSIATSEK
jgi:hypothetical protein